MHLKNNSSRRVRCWMLLVAVIAPWLCGPAHATWLNELQLRPHEKATKRLAYGKERDQFGDLWLPDKAGSHPVVILIHGGCWQTSLPGLDLMDFMAEDLRAGGIAVWNLEYRRLGAGRKGYPNTFLDVADGTDYLRQIAATYRLDLSHVVVMGHSAGGQLALWAAARPRLLKDSPLYRKDPLAVSAVITLAGVDDLEDYRANGPAACGGPHTIDQLVNAAGRQGQNLYADTSPSALLPMGVPQTIVSGEADNIVPERFGDDYARAAEKAGDKPQVLTIHGANHFDLIDPLSIAWPQIKACLLSYLK